MSPRESLWRITQRVHAGLAGKNGVMSTFESKSLTCPSYAPDTTGSSVVSSSHPNFSGGVRSTGLGHNDRPTAERFPRLYPLLGNWVPKRKGACAVRYSGPARVESLEFSGSTRMRAKSLHRGVAPRYSRLARHLGLCVPDEIKPKRLVKLCRCLAS